MGVLADWPLSIANGWLHAALCARFRAIPRDILRHPATILSHRAVQIFPGSIIQTSRFLVYPSSATIYLGFASKSPDEIRRDQIRRDRRKIVSCKHRNSYCEVTHLRLILIPRPRRKFDRACRHAARRISRFQNRSQDRAIRSGRVNDRVNR